MGYNIKTAFCDLVEFEKRGAATISAIFGSETLGEGQNIVDLKLGSLGDFGRSFANSSKVQTGSHMERTTAGSSSKRGRIASNGGQVVASCLVDGCRSDLSKCRDYHRRHKVCEMHSKAPRVTIGGNEQRFCQQCSRFHSLGEFDEGKRSCRKRLEGHNRRRRKPQPETLAVNHANFLSASTGSKLFPLSNQAIIPSSPVVSTIWSSGPKPESNPTIFSSSPMSGSYCEPYRGGRQFPFLQGPESPISAGSLMLHHNPNPSSGGSVNTQKMLCNDLNQQQQQVIISSDRALSLLSSSPDMGLGLMNRARSTMDGDLEYTGVGPNNNQGLEGHSGGSAFMSNINMRSSNTMFQDVFQSGTSSGSSSGGHGHPTLSFSWE